MAKKRRTLSDSLHLAISRLWSGRIDFYANAVSNEIIGEIVFAQGQIAWARAAGQQETLGTFLWRLGRVTRDQLVIIQRRYRAAGGNRRLGALLEEAGFMTRPVLRRALMLHARSAIGRILKANEAMSVMRGGRFGDNEEILFRPDEVLPSGWSERVLGQSSQSDRADDSTWLARHSENEILTPYAPLEGYRACGIISGQGDVLVAHQKGEDLGLRNLAVSIAAMFEASTRAAGGTALGSVDFVLLDCANGGLTARWIDERRTHFLFVLQETSGNQALARFIIKGAMDQLKAWLDRHMNPEHRNAVLAQDPEAAERYATDPFWHMPRLGGDPTDSKS